MCVFLCMFLFFFLVCLFFFFFFFQAEDGIRDLYVTGVQTCALPICLPEIVRDDDDRIVILCDTRKTPQCGRRSEERRVGKECRTLLLRYVSIKIFLNPQCLASISRWITASSSWKRFCLFCCLACISR